MANRQSENFGLYAMFLASNFYIVNSIPNSLISVYGKYSRARFDEWLMSEIERILYEIGGFFLISAAVFIVSCVLLAWSYTQLIVVPYLYIKGYRTAPKAMIQGEEQIYYDYSNISRLKKFLSFDTWTVDKSADTFTWSKYRSTLLKHVFTYLLIYCFIVYSPTYSGWFELI